MKKLMLIVTVTSFFLLVSVITSSAQYIENWTYDIQYGFSSFTDGDTSPSHPVTDSAPNTNYENYPTVLKWGKPFNDDNGQSSIAMNPPSLDGTINVNDDPVNGPNIIHNNYQIVANTGSLTNAILSSRLSLSPTGYVGEDFEPYFRDFYISFAETPNEYGNEKDYDIFMIENFQNFEEEFEFADYTYKAIFNLESFDELTEFQKSFFDLGADDEAYGFTTPEGLSTTKATEFSIELISGPNNPVPEPSTLILFGLGIFGLAGIARKKIKQ